MRRTCACILFCAVLAGHASRTAVAGAAPITVAVGPGTNVPVLLPGQTTAPVVVATAARTIVTAVTVPLLPTDPISWTATSTPATTVTYSGTSAVVAQHTWTATNLVGTFGGGGGGGGGAASSYTLRAREAAVEISSCSHSNTPFQEIFTTSSSLARRPNGGLAFAYVGTPTTITHAASEAGVPDPWGYTHKFTIVVGEIHSWVLTVTYTGPDGETASHSKTCI